VGSIAPIIETQRCWRMRRGRSYRQRPNRIGGMRVALCGTKIFGPLMTGSGLGCVKSQPESFLADGMRPAQHTPAAHPMAAVGSVKPSAVGCLSADYRAAVLDLPPRMARCASKSFATLRSRFISIKVCCRRATNPDKCGLYQHGICWIPCSGRVCRPKNELKVRAGRAGGSHHKAWHCWCDDPRSR
jgi:hypothetical protein